MLKSERRPVRTALRQLFWYSLQIAIIAFWLWVEWDRSKLSGEPARPGLALMLGVGSCLVVSVLTVLAQQLFGWLWLRLVGGELPHVNEPAHRTDKLIATRGQPREPLKLGPRARISQEPR
jgi:hypothetical protein